MINFFEWIGSVAAWGKLSGKFEMAGTGRLEELIVALIWFAEDLSGLPFDEFEAAVL